MPFAVLMPIDLASQTCKSTLYKGGPSPGTPAELETKFQDAGKLSFLETQMMWVVGNIPAFNYVEMFASQLLAPAPLLEMFNQAALTNVPANLNDWIAAQNDDATFPSFLSSISGTAVRDGLHIFAPDDTPPKILVPEPCRVPLIRATHEAMNHLGSAKVTLALQQSHYWPTLASDCRAALVDCAGCELEKARRNEAHAMFSKAPTVAPRSQLPWIPVLGRFACHFSRKWCAGPFFGARAGAGAPAHKPSSVLSP
jgi:hypothetical protein